MKYISKWYIASLAIAFCCLASACSPDEELAPVEVSFTAPGEFDMSALDSCESIINTFELTANGAWTLYSDKMWVKFSLERDGFYFNDLKGGAGTHTVYVQVTNEARDFNDSQATISLMTNEKTQNVVTISRKGIEHTFALLSSEGEVIDTIEIGASASALVTPDANFEYSLLSYPSWLDEPQAFSGGISIDVLSSFVPYEQAGTVMFGNLSDSVFFEYPVVYTGMDPNVIIIDGEYTPWNWEVSLDGKTFVQENSSASDENVETIVENSLPFSVTCSHYDYKLLSAQVNDGKLALMDESESWILASQDENDPSQLSVSVATSESATRSGYLFAVPTAMYSNFVDSLALSSDVDAFIDSNVNYVVIALEQKEMKDTDGFIIAGNDGASVECIVEEEYYEWLCSEFTITDLTTCNLVPGQSYTIDTRLGASDWDGNFAITDLEGTHQRLKSWGNPTPELGEDGSYKLNITVPSSLEKTIILRLYTPQVVNIKAIVIRPVAQ